MFTYHWSNGWFCFFSHRTLFLSWCYYLPPFLICCFSKSITIFPQIFLIDLSNTSQQYFQILKHIEKSVSLCAFLEAFLPTTSPPRSKSMFSRLGTQIMYYPVSYILFPGYCVFSFSWFISSFLWVASWDWVKECQVNFLSSRMAENVC